MKALIGTNDMAPISVIRMKKSVVPDGTLHVKRSLFPRNKLQGYNTRRAEWHSELFEARICRNLSKE